MAKIVDTHSHLFMAPLNRRISNVLKRAFAVGVVRIIVPATSASSWEMCLDLSILPGIDCALGIYPWWADEGVDIIKLKEKLIVSKAVAIGEIGLDWKADVSKKSQITVLEKQLKLAVDMNLPVILHCYKAYEELLKILADYPVRGVIHSWTKNHRLMDRFLDLGLYISFGGIITNTNAVKARECVKLVPENRFLLETDSPSMGLLGVKSGFSEPMFVVKIAQTLADLREESLEQVLDTAWDNSIELFGETN